jgi:hypothetical protein
MVGLAAVRPNHRVVSLKVLPAGDLPLKVSEVRPKAAAAWIGRPQIISALRITVIPLFPGRMRYPFSKRIMLMHIIMATAKTSH